jgi:heterodisulfide reductase subunit A
LINRPRYIDLLKCTGCGQCNLECPVTAINEFDCALGLRGATYIKYAQAVPLAYIIDRDVCIGCGLCEKICMAGAVRYDDEPRRTTLDVGAVILATGNELFDPSGIISYGYTQSPNVITSMEFERILSAGGPYAGNLMRPYDREVPKKIAWLQCVGSREHGEGRNPYCSAVCCMYAIKEAVIAKEHAHGELDTAIFYMDMRTYGKDFEEYYVRAKEEHGVRFIPSRVHTVEPVGDGDLKISYVDQKGKRTTEIFDLVVLSVGFQVGRETIELVYRLGLELGPNNFANTNSFKPVATTRPGIYVCGSLQSPKDIPQSVMEASAAAAVSGVLLNDVRWIETEKVEKVPEIDVSGEMPRIGVFVCHCGINIAGTVDVYEVREYAKTLPYVVYVEDNLYTCSQDTQVKMAQVIQEQGINRVVVASCTPKTHEHLFQETLQSAGLNKYLFEMANIRNQASWVHSHDPRSATEKSKDLVRMAVAKAALLEPLFETELGLNPETLVVGGGVAGMVAAKTLADQGYDVHLVERADCLGGQANFLYKTWKGEDIQDYVKQLSDEVTSHPKIHVHLSTKLSEVEGFVGNFKSTLTHSEGIEIQVNHGIAIIATGAHEYKPHEFLYGQDPRVLTHLELDACFIKNDPLLGNLKSAVFIQCVGSRNSEHPYCSRVCCSHSIESALELKRRNPDIAVYVLYRDIRTYGEREELFHQARQEGVLFFRYDSENAPLVTAEDGLLKIELIDHIIGRPIQIDADLLVLATAIVPPDSLPISRFFKVPLDKDGFFSEAHVKLRPVDCAADGIFLCGLAHAPKSIDESITQAQAAASRAITILAMEKILVGGVVSYINPERCSGCLGCIHVCPFGAITFDSEKETAEVNPVLCKGCGACASTCPSEAPVLMGFNNSQLYAQIESALYA